MGTTKIGRINLQKVFDGFYCGYFTAKNDNKMDIIIERNESKLYIGYCKQHKNVRTSYTIKGCAESIEDNLIFWGY